MGFSFAINNSFPFSFTYFRYIFDFFPFCCYFLAPFFVFRIIITLFTYQHIYTHESYVMPCKWKQSAFSLTAKFDKSDFRCIANKKDLWQANRQQKPLAVAASIWLRKCSLLRLNWLVWSVSLFLPFFGFFRFFFFFDFLIVHPFCYADRFRLCIPFIRSCCRFSSDCIVKGN